MLILHTENIFHVFSSSMLPVQFKKLSGIRKTWKTVNILILVFHKNSVCTYSMHTLLGYSHLKIVYYCTVWLYGIHSLHYQVMLRNNVLLEIEQYFMEGGGNHCRTSSITESITGLVPNDVNTCGLPSLFCLLLQDDSFDLKYEHNQELCWHGLLQASPVSSSQLQVLWLVLINASCSISFPDQANQE